MDQAARSAVLGLTAQDVATIAAHDVLGVRVRVHRSVVERVDIAAPSARTRPGTRADRSQLGGQLPSARSFCAPAW